MICSVLVHLLPGKLKQPPVRRCPRPFSASSHRSLCGRRSFLSPDPDPVISRRQRQLWSPLREWSGEVSCIILYYINRLDCKRAFRGQVERRTSGRVSITNGCRRTRCNPCKRSVPGVTFCLYCFNSVTTLSYPDCNNLP